MEQNIISDILQKGCKDKKTAALTYQVYLDFIENKKYHAVLYDYHESLEIMYITAKFTKSTPESIFIPISSFDNISFNTMQKLIDIDKSKTVYLTILSPDSTLVCYQISDGLPSPSTFGSKDSKHEKRRMLDNELNKRQKDIKTAAVSNIPLSSIQKL